MAKGKPTRKGAAASGPRQSSLSFGHSKVTKPSIQAGKDKLSADAKIKAEKLLKDYGEIKIEPSESADTSIEDIKNANDEKKIWGQGDLVIRSQSSQNSGKIAEAAPLDQAELTAKEVSDAQILKYWKAKETERRTPRGN
jgi:hypothetical protein